MDCGHDLRFGTFLTPAADRPEQVVALAQLTERAGLDLGAGAFWDAIAAMGGTR
jgi:hypothetical protein